MRKIILSFSFLCCSLFATAQSNTPEVIASAGGFATGAGFTNSFTLGQGSLPETFSAGTFILTQGFQQPPDIPTGFAPISDPFSFGTYPNPTSGEFFLQYDLSSNSEVVIEAFDVLGQTVYSETSTRTTGKQIQSVNISDQMDGVYFIRCNIKSTSGITSYTTKITLTR
jgi:hypothetical protein